ncbi:eisosome protein SEG2-like protein [Tanacetum coccineum]
MGCFLQCLGSSKDHKRLKRRNKNKVIPNDQVPLICQKPTIQDILSVDVSLDLSIQEKPSNSVQESREKTEVPPLRLKRRKKVTFDTNVTTYEPPIQVYDSTESLLEKNEKGETFPKSESDTNYRYGNCLESDDEFEDFDHEDYDFDEDDYDLDDEDDDDGYGDVEEVLDPSTESNRNARDENGYILSILNPVENLDQWKALKSKGTTKPLSVNLQKENLPQEKNQTQETAVDASLSNWIDRQLESKICEICLVSVVHDVNVLCDQASPCCTTGEQIPPEDLAAHAAWVKGQREVAWTEKTLLLDAERNFTLASRRRVIGKGRPSVTNCGEVGHWRGTVRVSHRVDEKRRRLPHELDLVYLRRIGYPKETMGYSFYSPSENKVFIEEFQEEEDTNPSLDTSLNHEEDDQEINEPQSDINHIRSPQRKRRQQIGNLKRQLRFLAYYTMLDIEDDDNLIVADWICFFLFVSLGVGCYNMEVAVDWKTNSEDDGVLKGARHFRAKVHYLRETIKMGDVRIEKIDTDDNLADPFTKALAFPKHSELTRNIGLLPASNFM